MDPSLISSLRKTGVNRGIPNALCQLLENTEIELGDPGGLRLAVFVIGFWRESMESMNATNKKGPRGAVLQSYHFPKTRLNKF